MSIRIHPPGGTRPKQLRRNTRTALVPAARTAPAGPRAQTPLSVQELDLSGDAIETFTLAVGGRAKLLATLAVADSDASTDKVINCLLDDQYSRWSLRRICAYAGITVADLFAAYKKALFVQAHIDAAHRITRALPPIIDDVMARAQPIPRRCPRCDGAPTTPDTSPCPQCQGTGISGYSEPDLDRQKLALELGRLTEKRYPGVVVNQNAIATGSAALAASGPGSLEQLQQAVGELLFSPGRRRAAAPQAPIVDVPSTAAPEAEG